MVLVGYRYSPPRHPPDTHPGYTPCMTLLGAYGVHGSVRPAEYGRGAQIRRPTLFMYWLLRLKDYDRGI